MDWQMEGIDVKVGMGYAGNDEELYREILTDYIDNIEERAGIIEQAVKTGNAEVYIIETHALKSTSKTIGAIALSELAAELEEASKNGEWELVAAKTPGLLSLYRALYDAITPYRIVTEEPGSKKEFNAKEVLELLQGLYASMEEFDSVRGERLTAELQEYDYAPEHQRHMDGIASAMNKFDYDICMNRIEEWRKLLKGSAT